MQPNALLRDRRGYSIGELLWVLVIMGIMTAKADPAQADMTSTATMRASGP